MLAVLATLALTTGLAGCGEAKSAAPANPSNETSAEPSSFVPDPSAGGQEDGVVTRLTVKAPTTVI